MRQILDYDTAIGRIGGEGICKETESSSTIVRLQQINDNESNDNNACVLFNDMEVNIRKKRVKKLKVR